MKKRILCLWLPRWPIQRRVVAQPSLSGRPIVLHARDVRRGECVAVCSTAAMRRGVRPGMPLAEAISLLEAEALSPSESSPSHRRKPAEAPPKTTPSATPRHQRLSEAKTQHALAGHAGRGRESFSAQGVAATETVLAEKDSRPREATAPQPSSDLFHLEPHQPEADRQALLQLAAWCEQFSPQVGLETHPQPQSLLLDVTGLGPLFGGEEALAWRVIEAFGRRGYWVRAAVAATVGAAWALSRFGADPRSGTSRRVWRAGGVSPLMESASHTTPMKSTPEVQRPLIEPTSRAAQRIRGLTPPTRHDRHEVVVSAPRIVPPGEHLHALAPLAVEALRLPAPTLTALHQLGVFQIGQVLELPRAGLASRFQHEGRCVLIERLDQALGAAEELIAPHRPPPEFRAERCFEHPLTRQADVEAVLAELFDSVCRQLAIRDQGALRSICRLDCEGGEVQKLTLSLFQPTTSSNRLLELAAMQLERLRLPCGVGRVGVEVKIAAPLGVRQQALFAEQGRSRPRELALLIDRLSSRLGCECVVRARLLSDAQPERAFCEEALVGMRNEDEMWNGESKRRKQKTRRNWEDASSLHSAFRIPHSAFARPLRLWSPPIPIEVIAAAAGPPASFRVGRRRFRVYAWWGPERIETAWWRGRSIRRDYYQVETTTGARYWLYRQLRHRRWFLHGEYG